MGRVYRVGEFAALTGVSVRALHHYDRIGLLRPSGWSEGGHRLYAEADMLRLQQVLTLRYLGFPLRQIRELLDRPDFDLLASMRIQRAALRDRIAELERVTATLDSLLNHRQTTGAWQWDLVVQASSAVQAGLAQKGDRMSEYYSPEQLQRFEEMGRLAQERWTPEERALFEEWGREVSEEERREVERGWLELIPEVRANLHLNPASPDAQALAQRWQALMEATFRGNTAVMAAVGRQYEAGTFDGQPEMPDAEVHAFIERVLAAGK